MQDIGKHIRQQRLRQNMTQDDLAQRIHATRQTVSNYETGRSRPDIDTLHLLAQALECDIQILLYGKAHPASNPREVRRLVIGLCLLGSILTSEVIVGLIWPPVNITHYQVHPLALSVLYLLRYARTVLLGWCALQALRAFRLLRPLPCKGLRIALLCLSALWPLYLALNFLTARLSISWLAALTRLLLRQHLWPGYLLWGIVVFTLGVALCFTEKA